MKLRTEYEESCVQDWFHVPTRYGPSMALVFRPVLGLTPTRYEQSWTNEARNDIKSEFMRHLMLMEMMLGWNGDSE